MENRNYEKIKTIILVTIGVVTVLAIGLSSILRNSNLFRKHFDGGRVIEDTIVINEDFDEILVDISISKLDVKYGNETSISYKLPEKLIPSIKVNNNALDISNENVNINAVDDLKDFADADYYLTLTIPENSEYKNIEINLDCGDIRLDRLVTDTLALESDCGNIELEGLRCDKASFSADLGNIELDNIVAKELELDVDCGNIEIDGVDTDTVLVQNSLGNIEFKQAIFKSGEFYNDMGDIKVDGDYEAITADCSLGSIDITTSRTESEVKMNLNVDLGSVRVNGKDWKTK